MESLLFLSQPRARSSAKSPYAAAQATAAAWAPPFALGSARTIPHSAVLFSSPSDPSLPRFSHRRSELHHPPHSISHLPSLHGTPQAPRAEFKPHLELPQLPWPATSGLSTLRHELSNTPRRCLLPADPPPLLPFLNYPKQK